MKRSRSVQSSSGSKFKRTAFALVGSAILLGLCAVLITMIFTGGNSINAQTSVLDYAKSELTIWNGEPLPTADDFLNDNTRSLVDSARYLVVPGTDSGDQNIAILMQLGDGTTRTENAVLTIREPVITWELGTAATSAELLGEEYSDAVLSVSLSDIKAVGSYDITVRTHGKELPFTLVAQDTTAPVVKIYDTLSFYVHQEISAKDFVESCEDLSAVEYHFSEEPTTMLQGTYSTQLIVTDASGNSTTCEITYAVSGDGEPPVISGVTDMTTIVGIPVSYLHGVTANDTHDGEVAVTAKEQEGFSLRKAGDYTVTFSAQDEAGNVATETATLHVLPSIDEDVIEQITEDDVLRMGDYIVQSIDHEGDTSRQYLRKLYNYVQGHMVYHGSSQRYEWYQSAAVALYQGYGDCRNYYGFGRLLLTCAGFENMMVEKVKPYEGATNHYWSLVNVDGAWYHFDTTPRYKVSDFFLWTDAQMDAFSAKNNQCFNRDKSLYPATPE
ncbi:MAG: transglutaminase domain-containing protein [Oscillospiraceae bacterium]|nr:transglutaminase domain-containing protein [Oscillospiraceae bacterium]